MHAFFWGAGMVTSLVPRDIEPLTVLEAIVTTSTMFFGLLLNAFVISSLNQALHNMNSKMELTGSSKQLEHIKSYLLLKAVPSDLRAHILEYYEYLFTSSAALDKMNVLEHMPPSLAARLALSTHRKLAARCPFFRDVSNASLVRLITELHPLVFVPEQTILWEGLPLSSVYLINRGTVQVRASDGHASATLTNGENFGFDDYSRACVSSAPPTVTKSISAITYCDLMGLSVDALEATLLSDATFQASLKARRAGRPVERTRPKPKRQNTMRRDMSLWGLIGKSLGGADQEGASVTA